MLAILFALLVAAGFFLHHTLSAFLTSLALAFLLNPLLKILERGVARKRMTAIILLYLLCSVVLLALSLLVVPYIGHQADLLSREMPRYLQNVKHAVGQWQAVLSPYDSGEEGEWLIARTEEFLTALTERVSGLGFEKLTGLLFGLFNLLLAPILVFFMLFYKEYFKKLLARLIPAAQRDYLIALGREINRSLERFILAMLVDCFLVGVLCVIALHLLGIQFPLLNGLLAGALSIVPVIGGIVAVIPPAFLGYAATSDLVIIPKLCAVYFAIFVLIEGNLLKPLIMKRALKLNPLAVIFAVMALGELLGFWGVVLAIPLTAVVKICAGEIERQRRNGWQS